MGVEICNSKIFKIHNRYDRSIYNIQWIGTTKNGTYPPDPDFVMIAGCSGNFSGPNSIDTAK